jgi:carboxymethylenebutenolidase
MAVEEPIEIRTLDGVSEGFLYRPESGSLPAVIHLTDIRGVRPSHREMAKRLAEQGFTVLLPNIFYRTSRPPVFDFDFVLGEPRTMKRIGELAAPLTPEGMERDAAAYVDFLAAQPSAAPGMMGVVGYCISGQMAMRTAAVRPARIAAAASFHGGGLYTDASSSPHLALPRIKARLYFGHAVEDMSMPAEAIKKFESALAAWGGRYVSETYEGARHGWTVPDSAAYNPPAAQRAFQKLTAHLAEALK